MFDLIEGKTERPFRDRAPGSKVVAAVIHVAVITLVIGIPLLTVTDALPRVPEMMAFVAAAPAPPPPPPPPAPPKPKTAEPEARRPEPPTQGAFAAPIEAPSEVKPEATTASVGVEGGVEGGITGGVVGGIVGGIVEAPPPPPPPPPPPLPPTPAPPRGPVRIGGQLKAPAIVKQVNPVFSDLSVAAHLTGVVILEAVVDTQGHVESVSILRPRHPLLDHAAVDALKQWQYSPLVLNGIATPFVLTVTFNFSIGP